MGDPSIGYGFVPTQRYDTYPAIDPLKSDLSGKNVLITGAARGLGREMALAYTEAGVSAIVVFDVLDTAAVETDIANAAKSSGRPQPTVFCMKVDVTSIDEVERAAQVVKDKIGNIDILINNAAIGVKYEPVIESDPLKWWRCWEVNVKGVYLMTKFFLPLVLASKDKTLIVISSIGALHTIPGGSSYETTKLAVIKINNYLMAEYGSEGLLAYAVAPGGVKTEMAADFPIKFHKNLSDTPRLVADTLVFLTKEPREWLASRYVDSRWDMEEFMKRKEEIIRDDLIKVKLRV